MTKGQFWQIVERLRNANLVRTADYECEGPPEQCRHNPPGTMILVHPGVRLSDLPAGVEEEDIEGGSARSGVMASIGSPSYLFKGMGRIHAFETDDEADGMVWQYLFVPDDDEDEGGA